MSAQIEFPKEWFVATGTPQNKSICWPPGGMEGSPYQRMGCCGIVAIATVANEEVHDVFERARKRLGQTRNWKGALSVQEFLKSLHEEGVRLGGRHPHEYRQMRRTNGFKWRCTVSSFCREYANRDTTYILVTGDHFITTRGGYLVDQTLDGVHYEEATSVNRMRIQRVFLIA